MHIFCYFGYNIFHLEMILGWSGGTVIVQEGGARSMGRVAVSLCSENTNALNSTGTGNTGDNTQPNDKAERWQMTCFFKKSN